MLKIDFNDLKEQGLIQGSVFKLYIARGEGGSSMGPHVNGREEFLVDCIFNGTIYKNPNCGQALYKDTMLPVGMPLSAHDVVKANPNLMPPQLKAFIDAYELFQSRVDDERDHLAELIEDSDESDVFFCEELTIEEEEAIAKRWLKKQPEHDYFKMQRFLLEFREEYSKWVVNLNNEQTMQ